MFADLSDGIFSSGDDCVLVVARLDNAESVERKLCEMLDEEIKRF